MKLKLPLLNRKVKVPATAANTLFVVRFAHPNAFGTSQTHKMLGEKVLRARPRLDDCQVQNM